MNLKKWFAVSLVCGVFGMICAGENLIRNPEFELSTGTGSPKGWNIRKGVDASFGEDKDGKYMKLVCLPDGKTSLVLQHGIRLQANREYVFSVNIKGSAGSRFSAYLETSKPVWQTYASPWRNATGKWQVLSFRFKLKDFKAQPYLGLRAKGKGEVLIKNPSIKTVPGSLVNGDFSAGSQPWKISRGKVVDLGKSAGKFLELNSSETASDWMSENFKRLDTIVRAVLSSVTPTAGFFSSRRMWLY